MTHTEDRKKVTDITAKAPWGRYLGLGFGVVGRASGD